MKRAQRRTPAWNDHDSRSLQTNRTAVRLGGTPARGWILVGSFDYNRKDFGVDYQNSGFPGLLDASKNKIIRDLIDVNVSLKLKPNNAQ